MNSILKTIIICCVILALFRLGYKKGSHAINKSNVNLKKNVGEIISPKLYRLQPKVGKLTGKSKFLLNGVPAEVDMVTSDEPIAKIINDYNNKWSFRGYKVSVNSVGNMNFASAIDGNMQIFECAIMIPDTKSKKTTIIPVRLDLSVPVVQSTYKTTLYPLCTPVFHIESNDMGGYSENIIFTSDANIQSIINFYKGEFSQKGWLVEKPEKDSFTGPNSSNVLFLKGSDELWLYASKMERNNKSIVFLLFNDQY